MEDIIQLNQAEIVGQRKDMVRGTVEESLNRLPGGNAARIASAYRMNEANDGRIPVQALYPVVADYERGGEPGGTEVEGSPF